MNNDRITSIAQVGTGVVLILGLLLVVYELNLAKSFTFAEMISQGYSETMQDSRTIMGENPAIAIAKSCDAPDSLNAEELVILQAYYNSELSQVARLRSLEAVADFGVPWQVFAEQLFRPILATEHGRWWLREATAGDQQLINIVQNILVSEPNCLDDRERFKKRL